MNPESAKEIFPTLEHWMSFNELADQRALILDGWFGPATQQIRQHFTNNPVAGWSFIPWGAMHRDTKWYLESFGPDSIFLAFGWYYELQLRLENVATYSIEPILKALESGGYSKLKQAFGRIDRYIQPNEWNLMERGNYEFGFPRDRNLSHSELAWCAAFKTDDFVRQSIKKIERFVRDDEVTAQIHELNEIGLKSKDSPVDSR